MWGSCAGRSWWWWTECQYFVYDGSQSMHQWPCVILFLSDGHHDRLTLSQSQFPITTNDRRSHFLVDSWSRSPTQNCHLVFASSSAMFRGQQSAHCASPCRNPTRSAHSFTTTLSRSYAANKPPPTVNPAEQPNLTLRPSRNPTQSRPNHRDQRRARKDDAGSGKDVHKACTRRCPVPKRLSKTPTPPQRVQKPSSRPEASARLATRYPLDIRRRICRSRSGQA